MFEDRADYLYAAVTGPRDSREISIAYWTDIARECGLEPLADLLLAEPERVHASFVHGYRHLPAVLEKY